MYRAVNFGNELAAAQKYLRVISECSLTFITVVLAVLPSVAPSGIPP